MPSVVLRAYGRELSSPFDLLGTDERALTFAFGWTLSRSVDFLQGFLRLVGAGGLRRRSLAEATIHLECRHVADRSITDIEVYLPRRLRVIVEAKVGLAMPTPQQCRKYLEVLQKGPEVRERRLVFLTAVPGDALPESHRQELPELAETAKRVEWTQLRHLAADLARLSVKEADRSWLLWFLTFLEKGYRMRSFTHEVWIVPVNKRPLWAGGLSFYDTHVTVEKPIYYRAGWHGARPLYIALRVQGRVSTIQRVVEVVHDAAPSEYVPELTGRHLWCDKPHTIWRLEKPVALPHSLPVGYKLGQAMLYCDLDMLLSSTTLKEVADAVRKRYGKVAVP